MGVLVGFLLRVCKVELIEVGRREDLSCSVLLDTPRTPVAGKPAFEEAMARQRASDAHDNIEVFGHALLSFCLFVKIPEGGAEEKRPSHQQPAAWLDY